MILPEKTQFKCGKQIFFFLYIKQRQRKCLKKNKTMLHTRQCHFPRRSISLPFHLLCSSYPTNAVITGYFSKVNQFLTWILNSSPRTAGSLLLTIKHFPAQSLKSLQTMSGKFSFCSRNCKDGFTGRTVQRKGRVDKFYLQSMDYCFSVLSTKYTNQIPICSHCYLQGPILSLGEG